MIRFLTENAVNLPSPFRADIKMRLPALRIPVSLVLNTGSLYIGDERCSDNVHVVMIAIYMRFVHYTDPAGYQIPEEYI